MSMVSAPTERRLEALSGFISQGIQCGRLSLSPNTCAADSASGKQSITVTDNRTGKKYEIPIKHATVVATKFLEMKDEKGNNPLKLYDPGFMNTISATSRICEIQGGKGMLL